MYFAKLFFSSQLVISEGRRERVCYGVGWRFFLPLLWLSWLALPLLWLYHIQQDSVSGYEILFLKTAYPGKANCFL